MCIPIHNDKCYIIMIMEPINTKSEFMSMYMYMLPIESQHSKEVVL